MKRIEARDGLASRDSFCAEKFRRQPTGCWRSRIADRGLQAPTLHSVRDILLTSGGVALAILCVAWLTLLSNTVFVLGSFGSSCVILFCYPESRFSQPRNFVAGHFLSSLIGLSFLHLVGPQWWAMAVATGVVTATMMATRTLHPPAGSNPLIVYLMHSDWEFLWFPTLVGALVVQGVAVLYHKWISKSKYPQSWL